MIISKEYVKSLNASEYRLNNIFLHHPDWSGTLEEFLSLENIDHEDKKWVFFRSIDKDYTLEVVYDLIEKVRHIYEAKYPSDDRLGKALLMAGNDICDIDDIVEAVRLGDAMVDIACKALDCGDIAASRVAAAASEAIRAAYSDNVKDIADAASDALSSAADAAKEDAHYSAEEQQQLQCMKHYAKLYVKDNEIKEKYFKNTKKLEMEELQLKLNIAIEALKKNGYSEEELNNLLDVK